MDSRLIKRLHGTTGVPGWLPDETKSVIWTWAFLLPCNGHFGPEVLARLIRSAYDESNPRTAADLVVLDELTAQEAI